MTRPRAAIGLSVACAVVLLAGVGTAAASSTARDDTAATSAGNQAFGSNGSTAHGHQSGPIGTNGPANAISGAMGSPRSPARDIDGTSGGPNNERVANGRAGDGPRGPLERIGELALAR
jgi:hypothetical protein